MNTKEKQQLLEQSYHSLFEILYKYVYCRVPHAQDCEDIVAEVFLRSFKSIAQFEPDKGSLEQWLIGISKRAILDTWKKRTVTIDIEDAIGLLDSLQHKSHAQGIDQQIHFEWIVGHLSHEAQAILTLRYIDDLTYEEIASLLHKQPATVRKFFSRIHKKLHLQLADQLMNEL